MATYDLAYTGPQIDELLASIKGLGLRLGGVLTPGATIETPLVDTFWFAPAGTYTYGESQTYTVNTGYLGIIQYMTGSEAWSTQQVLIGTDAAALAACQAAVAELSENLQDVEEATIVDMPLRVTEVPKGTNVKTLSWIPYIPVKKGKVKVSIEGSVTKAPTVTDASYYLAVRVFNSSDTAVKNIYMVFTGTPSSPQDGDRIDTNVATLTSMSMIGDIPDDGLKISIGHRMSTASHFEARISQEVPVNSVVEEEIVDVKTVDISSLQPFSGYIGTTGNWGSSGNHLAMPVESYYKVLNVKASSSLSGAIVCFLNSIPSTKTGAASITDGSRHVLDSGEEVSLPIPSGARYIYIANYSGSQYVTPESMTITVSKDAERDIEDFVYGSQNTKEYAVGDAIDCNDYHHVYGRIVEPTWQTGNSLLSARIPVANIKAVTVVSNGSNNARVSFTSGREESGVASIIGTTTEISSTATLSVPAGAYYMIVDMYLQGGGSRIPESITVAAVGDMRLEYLGADTLQTQKKIYRKEVMSRLLTSKFNDAGKGVLTFLAAGDIHGSIPTGKELVDVADYYKDQLDFVIHLGDSVQTDFSSPFDFWNACGMQNIWNVIGNHDSKSGSNWSGAGQQAVHERYIAPYIDSWGVTKQDSAVDPYANYYYKDFALASSDTVRVICLDALFVTSAQLSWLEARLNEAKTSGYSVIILCHYPANYINTRTDVNFSTVYYKDFRSSSVPNISTDVTDLVSAFIAGGGKFICWINGHRHYDELGYSVLDDNLCNITIEKCASNQADTVESSWAVHEAARMYGEMTQHSFTFFVIDPAQKMLKMVRYGNHMNAYCKEKNVLCYDYANKTIIGQGCK